MRKFDNEEKNAIATIVQDAFLSVNGKRFHTCYWESLSLEKVLKWLDPDKADKYKTCWALTWFITDRPRGYGRARWDFAKRYSPKLRIPFAHEFEQRMAHSFVVAYEDYTMIDISTNYHADLLKEAMEIEWNFRDDYIWQPHETLPPDLKRWYEPALRVTDEESQYPPEGLIQKVADEACERLIAAGVTPEKAYLTRQV